MIFHLAVRDEWESQTPYRPSSVDEEGFIHCSTATQLVGVANDLYAGREDLLLLTIDPDELDAPVVYEDCYETGQRFPHVYGPLDPEAVVAVTRFVPDATGTFTWDTSLEG